MTNVEQSEFSMCTSLSKHETQNVRFIFPVDILTKSQERCVPQNVTCLVGISAMSSGIKWKRSGWLDVLIPFFLTGSADPGVDDRLNKSLPELLSALAFIFLPLSCQDSCSVEVFFTSR